MEGGRNKAEGKRGAEKAEEFSFGGGGGVERAEDSKEFWSLEGLSCGERSVMGPIGFLSFE